ncbi:hypothetical protein [Butyricicoccus intestinisimiae]|uniref:hypothetical protein n=1 Tax=Butyricicoccus intestinisimiae TaxID=2841509 RepID=UPI003D91735A
MNGLELFGRCLVELIFCMLICSACLWVDFTNRYDIIERRKMLDNMSLFRKANMVFIKSAWFESGVLTKISYYTLRFSGPLALSGSSASDTTKRDFWLEYTSAKKQLEQLQLDNSTNSKEFKKQVLRVQNAAYQYYRWRYSQRGEEFSQSAETEIQFVMQFFQMVDKDHSFVKKSMFFVPVEIYVLDFESAVEKKQLESALHILSFFIQKIGDVHDWNTEIGRNDLLDLNENCSVWFDLADKAEDFVNANGDMRQQLRSVYDDACISLMTAPKSLKQKAKQRKDLLK